ncbi:hypothetical protein D3C80_1528870 [compost metagenome]
MPQSDFVQAEVQAADRDFLHAGQLCQARDEPFVTPDRFTHGFHDDLAGVFGQVFPQVGIQYDCPGCFESRTQVFAGKGGLTGASWRSQEHT